MNEFVAVMLIVGSAVAYLGWTAWRMVVGTRKGCGSGCGKCAAMPEPAAKGRVALPVLSERAASVL
ncbi:MAG: hypothetical protein MUF18_21360 [Fimbriiglobus sp.]|nr:hypothetical protein [Fimbriiglobus sp.]